MTDVLLRLVLIEKAGEEPREMALGQVLELPLEFEKPYVVGKAPNVDLVIRSHAVGRDAIRLIWLRDGVWVRDLLSGGGSSLEMDGIVTDRPDCRLRHGAVLRIGRRGATGAVGFRVELLGGPGRDGNDPSWNIHDAAYLGRLDVVRRLLDEGADPNESHNPAEIHWVCGSAPLNKAIVAWNVTPEHVAVVALLLARGAKVDEGHFQDFLADSMGTPEDREVLHLLEQHRLRPEAVRARLRSPSEGPGVIDSLESRHAELEDRLFEFCTRCGARVPSYRCNAFLDHDEAWNYEESLTGGANIPDGETEYWCQRCQTRWRAFAKGDTGWIRACGHLMPFYVSLCAVCGQGVARIPNP